MTGKVRVLIISVLTIALSGCSGLPTYHADQGTTLSAVRLSPNMFGNTLSMDTVDGEYSLPSKDGVVYVPVDARIRIWRRYETVDIITGHINKTYSCVPGISFIPKTGVTYYLDFELRGSRCSLLVYREDPTSRVGIALEPTIERN